jgi:hypothetical protein
MIEIKPLKAEDVLYVISHGVKEVNLRATPTEEMKQLAKEREDSETCITGWVNGEIVGVAGVDMLWEGVGDMWLMLTPYIDSNIKETYKCIRQGVKKLIEKHNLRRVQSYGRVDFPECHTLFKHLGFEVEGMAKGYTPDGVNCVMYAKVK